MGTINELVSCLHNQIEAGAEGADKYYDDGHKAMRMIKKESERILSNPKKNKKHEKSID